MTAEPTPGAIRPPLQARSRASLARVLDAAEQLFGEHGFDDATINEIARRARLSVGGVYTRFADKAALFHAVQERFNAGLQVEWQEALAPARWQDAGLADVVNAVVAELLRQAIRHGGFIRAFAIRAMVDDAVRLRAVANSQTLASTAATLLLTRAGEIAHPDPVAAVDFGFRAVFAVTQQVLFYGGLSPTARAMALPQMAPELNRLYLSYLTSPAML